MKNSLLIALFAFGAAGGALNSAAAQTPAQLQSCLPIVSAIARLACYDRIAHAAVSEAAAPQAAAPYAPPRAAAPAPYYAPPQPMGAEQLHRPDSAALGAQALRLDVTSITVSPNGRFIVTLSDGEVWRQIEGDTQNPNLHRSITRTVTITHGFMGSYNLVFSDQGGRFKVERVQ